MIVSSQGVVIRTVKYGDTSLIVKVFTRDFGNQSFIVKNAFRKNNKFHASSFKPLSIINISFDDVSKGSLKYFKDVTPLPFHEEPFFNPVKNSLILFYNEIIYKLLRDSGADSELFDFIEEEVRLVYETPDEELAFAPTTFLLKLCGVLGYYPEDNFTQTNCFFSLQDSNFISHHSDIRQVMSQTDSLVLHKLMNGESVDGIPRTTRISLLKNIISYFQLHNDHIKNIDSTDILTTILH